MGLAAITAANAAARASRATPAAVVTTTLTGRIARDDSDRKTAGMIPWMPKAAALAAHDRALAGISGSDKPRAAPSIASAVRPVSVPSAGTCVVLTS